MSKKSSKLDLLVRVRFENPIPDPPFPPKLLNVSTDFRRLGEPSYLNQLSSSAPFPMLVDAEMGMPIDLNEYEGVWDGNDTSINPVPDLSRVTNPTDIELLKPLNITTAVNGAAVPSAAKSASVSWMRNSTSLIQRRNGTMRRQAATAQKAEVVDASEAAQIKAIDKTFSEVRKQRAVDMRHPDAKRKQLRVVESYDILPDNDAWSNSYVMFKFPERPSAATSQNPGAQASRGRLCRAVLRPLMEDDQQLVEFFLPKEDDLHRLEANFERPMDQEAVTRLSEFVEENGAGAIDEDEFPNVAYDRIRTYEVVTQAQPQKEYLITFNESPDADEDNEDDMFGGEEDQPARKKQKGVYFKEIHMRTQLRKTRAKVRGEMEHRLNHWDKLRVGYREPGAEEVDQRATAGQSVVEPGWADDQLRLIRNGGEDDDD